MSVLNLYESAKRGQDYISEIWESHTVWEFKEPTGKDKSLVDGKAIIGIIEGQFFVPDGKSRNERYYPKSLWESVLKSKPIQEKLQNLLMFGMIGHEDKAITEEDLRNGDVSHIIADLWIDESNKGMGKAYILNTDAGKNLYIYLKAGAGLKTSSRARGKFVESEKKDGLPVVDADSFYLETFDFVINPGFEETSATLMEKLLKEKRGDAVVGEQLVNETVKHLTESSEKLQSQLKSSIVDNTTLKIEKESLFIENKKLESKVNNYSFLENVDKSIVEALSEFDQNDWNNILDSKIKITGSLRESTYVYESVSYDAVFIPVKASKIPLNKFESVVKSTINEWDEKNVPVNTVFVKKKDNNLFGSNGLLILWKDGQRPMNAVESVKKLVIENNHDLFEGYGVPLTKAFTREQENQLNNDLQELNTYRQLGSVLEVSDALDTSTQILSIYQEIGSPNEINQALDKLSNEVRSYRELGSVDEVNHVVDLISEYVSLGTPSDVSKGIDTLSNTIKQYQEIGSIDEVNKVVDFMEEYALLGTPSQLSKGLDRLVGTIKEYQELGTVRDINKLVKIVEEYIHIGSPSELNEGLDKLANEVKSYRELGSVSEVDSLLSVLEQYAQGDSKDLLQKYMRIGTPEDVILVLENAKLVVSSYTEIGSISEINNAFDKVQQTLSKYAELGSYNEINSALDQSQIIIESYSSLGTPEEISEALDIVVDFSREIGRPSDIVESLEKTTSLLTEYKKLGTPLEVASALNQAMQVVESLNRKVINAETASRKASVDGNDQNQAIRESSRNKNIFESLNENVNDNHTSSQSFAKKYNLSDANNVSDKNSQKVFKSFNSTNVNSSLINESTSNTSEDGGVRNIFKSGNDDSTFRLKNSESVNENNSLKTKTNKSLENTDRFSSGNRVSSIFKNMCN